MPLKAADEAILTALERLLLDDGVVMEAMRRAIARAKRQPEDLVRVEMRPMGGTRRLRPTSGL